jgi:5-methyltetrahydropteroyltriglutamate--homocysteine methyltransferase
LHSTSFIPGTNPDSQLKTPNSPSIKRLNNKKKIIKKQDTAVTFNAIPVRYQKNLRPGLEQYFAMARGLQRPATDTSNAVDVPSLPMSKFFDTNYHYVPVPLGPDTRFSVDPETSKIVKEFLEAKVECGVVTRPAIVGPLSFLLLARVSKDANKGDGGFEKLDLLEGLVGCYAKLLIKLGEVGAEWVQVRFFL